MALQHAIRFASTYRTILGNTRPLSVMPIWISFTMSQFTYEGVEVYNCTFVILEVACSQVYSIHVSVDTGPKLCAIMIDHSDF